MSSGTLTIRNASALHMTLNQVEVFAALPTDSAPKSRFRTRLARVSGLTTTSPASDDLSTASCTFHTEHVALEILPFCILPTGIPTLKTQPMDSKITKLRLTFVITGQRYRLDISNTKDKSVLLVPLTNDAGTGITAVYLSASSFLVLLHAKSPERWMSNLPDSTSLADLSIPGTHNSSTYHHTMPCVRCQAVSVRKQLDNGIRFLDIRLQPASSTNLADENLYLVHGAFSVTLLGYHHFRGLMDRVYLFLDQNPSETVLISLKREGIGKASDDHLARILKRHYIDKNPSKWFTKSQIPNLGEARGKLVLIRRFKYGYDFTTKYAPSGWGIDASSWIDNSPSSFNETGQLCIQDFYRFLTSANVDEKITYVKQHLARAASASSCRENSMLPCLYINFASASNFWKTEHWPEKIAARLNPAVLEYLCREHMNVVKCNLQEQPANVGSTGIVVCDWIGKNGNWDLVTAILAMNETHYTNRATLVP